MFREDDSTCRNAGVTACLPRHLGVYVHEDDVGRLWFLSYADYAAAIDGGRIEHHLMTLVEADAKEADPALHAAALHTRNRWCRGSIRPPLLAEYAFNLFSSASVIFEKDFVIALLHNGCT